MSDLTLSRLRHGILVAVLAERARMIATSRHFAIYSLPAEPTAAQAEGVHDSFIVVHDFTPAQIDNNIGGHVADELLPLLMAVRAEHGTGAYTESEQELFERFVGAIVRSMDSNDRRAWHRFYDNTLARLRAPQAAVAASGNADFIGVFREVYARVDDLVAERDATSVLDVGSCFGFLPLYLARKRHDGDDAARRIVGCDLNPALVSLAEDYRQHRMIPGAEFVCADILADRAAELAVGGPAYDVVTAIHLIEHLSAEETVRAMANLWALTAGRLIIAVPFESEPDPRFGHQQAFDPGSLLDLGRTMPATCRFFEHHGGWLVLDRNETQQYRRWEEANDLRGLPQGSGCADLPDLGTDLRL
ncbi:MAG: methyltransferase domain-containing protein [Rhodospirillales bacterium]